MSTWLPSQEVGSPPARLVKRPEDLEGVAGLVLPGGESTTLSMLLESTGLFEAVAARLEAGDLRVFGTCAGLILVARSVLDGRPDQRTFGVLDAVVRRNGYGRQLQSFEGSVVFGSGESPTLPAVFIRAPLIVSMGDEVEVLATLDGVPVLVRQGDVLASSFHPELTPDRRIHRLFAGMCGRPSGRMRARCGPLIPKVGGSNPLPAQGDTPPAHHRGETRPERRRDSGAPRGSRDHCVSFRSHDRGHARGGPGRVRGSRSAPRCARPSGRARSRGRHRTARRSPRVISARSTPGAGSHSTT